MTFAKHSVMCFTVCVPAEVSKRDSQNYRIQLNGGSLYVAFFPMRTVNMNVQTVERASPPVAWT